MTNCYAFVDREQPLSFPGCLCDRKDVVLTGSSGDSLHCLRGVVGDEQWTGHTSHPRRWCDLLAANSDCVYKLQSVLSTGPASVIVKFVNGKSRDVVFAADVVLRDRRHQFSSTKISRKQQPTYTAVHGGHWGKTRASTMRGHRRTRIYIRTSYNPSCRPMKINDVDQLANL